MTAPPGTVDPPASCGNGTCDTGSEDCLNCPSDCSCCSAVASNGSGAPVKGEDNGLGDPDGAFVELDENSLLTLVLGREVFNDELGTSPDFKLVGDVENPAPQSGLCASVTSGTQAFEVQVSHDGVSYRRVGFWTQATEQQFDIGCAQVKSARFIRLQGQPGARAKLDAVQGLGTSCRTQK